MVAVRVAYSRVRAHSRRSSSKRCNSSLVRPVAETRVTVVVADISAVVTEVALVVTEAARGGIGNSNRSGSSNSKLPVPFPKRESMRLYTSRPQCGSGMTNTNRSNKCSFYPSTQVLRRCLAVALADSPLLSQRPESGR